MVAINTKNAALGLPFDTIGGAKPTNAPAKTAAPGVTRVASDGVDAPATPRPAALTRDAAEPFSTYALPVSESLAAGQRPAERSERSTALGVGVTDLVKELLNPAAARWIRDRSSYLAENPQEGVCTAMIGNAEGEAVARAIGNALSASDPAVGANVVASIVANFGEHAPAVIDAGKRVSAALLGGSAGVVNGETGAALARRGVAMMEASLEYYIACAGRMVTGDTDKDIQAMSNRLSELKKEKAAIVATILRNEASMLGLEMAEADQAARVAADSENAKRWGIIGAIAAVISSITIAVCSFGTAAPLAICACVVAVCTIILSLPQLVQGAGMVLEAFGADGAGKALDKAADGITAWMAKNTWFTYTVIAVEILASICSLGLSGGAAIASDIGQIINNTIVQVTIQVATALITNDLAKARQLVDMLRIQLTAVTVEIKALMQKLTDKRQDEDNVQDDIRARQDMQSTVMQSLGKAADAYAELQQATNILA